MQLLPKIAHKLLLALFFLSVTGCAGQSGSQKVLKDDWNQTNYAIHQKGVVAYESGDYSTALKEWTTLAEKGFARAQIRLGFLYLTGKGVEKDYVVAMRWYRAPAEQGYPTAQNGIGYMYARGQGVTQDYKTATKCFKLAAEQGNAKAQRHLGLMYSTGQGVTQTNTRADMWLILAAAQGDEQATRARKIIEEKMSSDDISKAQDLALECIAKSYKDC